MSKQPPQIGYLENPLREGPHKWIVLHNQFIRKRYNWLLLRNATHPLSTDSVWKVDINIMNSHTSLEDL